MRTLRIIPWKTLGTKETMFTLCVETWSDGEPPHVVRDMNYPMTHAEYDGLVKSIRDAVSVELPDGVEEPTWTEGSHVHNWRRYVPDNVRAMWDTFTDEQKLALYEWADEQAGKEEWD